MQDAMAATAIGGTAGPTELGAGFGELVAVYWPVLAVSFGVSLVMTPVCRRFARDHRIVDRPDDYLKPHHKTIAYLGGVAIYLGWAAGLVLALGMFATGDASAAGSARASMDVTMMIGILVAGTFVMVLGLLDDVRHVSPAGRLVVTLALGILLVACGLGDDLVLVLTRQVGLDFLPDSPLLGLALSVPVTLFVVMGACNATNVLDGLDGLCAGVMGIIFAGYLGLAAYLHAGSAWQPYDVQRIVLSSAVMGAAFGFLPYNRHPATIFMGDAGAMFLGMNAAILILLFAETAELKFALAGLMVFALPVTDMALAMFRRRRAGKPMMQGDRSHFYDQLVDRGYPVPRVVTIAYALAAGYVLLGWAAMILATRYLILLYVLAVTATVAAIKAAKMSRTDPLPSPETENHDDKDG